MMHSPPSDSALIVQSGLEPPTQSSTQSYYLPPELTDAIVHNLHDDKRALLRCSQVCRGWVPVTRYYLFSRVRLYREGRFRPFQDILADSHCTIIPFVRTLNIVGDWKGSPDPTGVPEDSMINFRDFCLPFLVDLPPRFPQLSRLELANTTLNSLGHLCTILDGCEALTSLRMERVDWLFSSEPITYTRSPYIQTIQLCEICEMSILDIFVGDHKDANCRTLSITRVKPHHMPSILHFLQALGPVLEDLTLEFDNYNFDDVAWSQLLRYNTQLAFLRLKFVFPDARALTAMITLLAAISSHRMARISVAFVRTLDLRVSAAVHFWSAIDQTLSSPQFASVQTLQFELNSGIGAGVGHTTDISAITSLLWMQMPLCSTRITVKKYRE
ncbi:hypothetical protein C8J57DRAFT_1311527 [Mycena rebaudengoi]|nr:hypothetical protein C8J57DRAFT_1311527 [Mycena rebaudengoi]